MAIANSESKQRSDDQRGPNSELPLKKAWGVLAQSASRRTRGGPRGAHSDAASPAQGVEDSVEAELGQTGVAGPRRGGEGAVFEPIL